MLGTLGPSDHHLRGHAQGITLVISLTIAAGLSVLLYVGTVLCHYEALRIISRLVERSGLRPRLRILLVLLGAVLAHLLEIAFYALMFWYADNVAHIGGFTGLGTDGVANYFYFSAETFTSLGMGDLYPRGALRLMTSLEVLNGLLLIGWSTSFTFLAMSRLWELHASAAAGESHARSQRHDHES
jgi:hypothetical protein